MATSQIITDRPWGTTLGDKLTELRNQLMAAELAKQQAAEAEAQTQARAARMAADPSVAQPAELAARMAMRRGIVAEPPATAPTLARGITPMKLARAGNEGEIAAQVPAMVRGITAIRDRASAASALRPAGRIVSSQFGTARENGGGPRTFRTGGLIETQQEAAQFTDPNFPAAYAGREAEARLHPNVLAAEARAEGAGGQSSQIAARAQGAIPLLGQIKELSNRIHTGEGLGQATSGLFSRGLAPMNLSPDVQLYEKLRPALASSLAALVQGARPSDLDLIVYRDFLPSPSTGKANAHAMLSAIEHILTTAATTGKGLTADELQQQLAAAAADVPTRGAGAGPPSSPRGVLMIAPDGRPLDVPADQVDEALRRGARRVGG